ncbi:MAG: OmpA family protein [Lachnospiraceae bacterium]|nr:OmpA family protein [Lachnospiraceae bacterium]
MIRAHHRKQDEETTYWLSYSDMMAGLLLVFVLIISLTVLHAKIQFDAKELELLGKEDELIAKSDDLEHERALVALQQTELDKQRIQLSEQGEELDSLQITLDEQMARLKSQEEALNERDIKLAELQALLDEQQFKLDNIIGVRGELIEALKKEFEKSNLHILVDEQTGAITFDASILFDYNEFVLKPTGEEFLSRFLPIYTGVLLSDKYKDYVSEILIEGHTDTDGDYLSNLELSQQRALSVAQYCLSDNTKILDKKSLEALRKVVAATGRSFSSPVLDENGKIDMDASRRVEFLFRLTDEEMIREMIEILSSDTSGG